ncbi:protein FAM227A isoform X2 [Anolis sagrei]|uniref:protein FAM227A isoform X2 n=1 Tax=Anolis sagrei TaxID=38937 RepID=UPI0035224172
MELINTESFVSPLKGFLTFPSGTQVRKSNPLLCKLDDKPRLYVIGSISKVNKKIAHLELGLKRYDSSDVVIDDTALKKRALKRGVKKGKGVSKITEKDQKGTQKLSSHSSETNSPISPRKIALKKVMVETDKLVELFEYPGYSHEETTPLPNGVELDDILEKVIRAQRKTSVAQTSWSLQMLRKFLSAPCIRAIVLDSFWWQFLQLYRPNKEIQGHLFERIAENYSRILLGCHKVSNREHILIFFPSILSQAVYTCFCYCFSRSWFNTPEFKAQLCDVFSEWFGGIRHAPGSYKKWNYSKLEPERSRRENLLSGKAQLRTGSAVSFTSDTFSRALQFQKRGRSPGKSTKMTKRTPSGQKNQHPKKEEDAFSKCVSSDYHLKEDEQKDSWIKQQSSQKTKKLKISLIPRESHPACPGPEFVWHRFNIGGRSPLIERFLEKRHALSKGGCEIFLPRREICKPIPESAQTYAEVVKEGFNMLCQRHKAFRRTYLKNRKEMRSFDKQFKANQELFRQEMQEEIKRRQAQKQKESFSAEALISSEKITTHFSKVSFVL